MDPKRSGKYIICALVLAFLLHPEHVLAKEISLESIKVNLIGKKTRVSFMFDKELSYTTHKLENPDRLLIDFQEPVTSHFDQVKVFDMGCVKNVRSYFLEESKNVYILDVCVVELDMECSVDIFWNESTLHVDFVDIRQIEAEQREEYLKKAARMKAEQLFEEGLSFFSLNNMTAAKKKFLESLRTDETFEKPKPYLEQVEKNLSKKEDDLKKSAERLEKELEVKLKAEKKEAVLLEKEIAKRTEEAFSRHMDAKDLEQKGRKAFSSGNYEKAVEYWNQVLDIYPRHRKAALYIVEAKRKLLQEKELLNSPPVSQTDPEKEKKRPQEHKNVLGEMTASDLRDQVLIMFPMDKEPVFRYAALNDPCRIMIYFKEKVSAALPPSKDVKLGMVDKVRIYYSPISDGTGGEEGSLKKIDALIVDLTHPCRFDIVHQNSRFQIILYKEKE